MPVDTTRGEVVVNKPIVVGGAAVVDGAIATDEAAGIVREAPVAPRLLIIIIINKYENI